MDAARGAGVGEDQDAVGVALAAPADLHQARRTGPHPRQDQAIDVAQGVGKRVRVVLHASHLVAYDQNVEVSRHERLIAKGRLPSGP